MELDYVVVTSVDRDDLPDCGASHFAATIRETRARSPQCRIEVLIPDFKGDEAPLRTVLDARPDVLNHNIETVPRLYRTARPGGRYERALQLLERSRSYAPDIPTKSGLMVGLGEEWDEVVQTLRDLSAVGCRIVTIGQYLRPSLANLPMSRYYTPAEFAELKRIGLELGFGHVESGPLVRSSYHAHEQTEAYEAQRAARAELPGLQAGNHGDLSQVHHGIWRLLAELGISLRRVVPAVTELQYEPANGPVVDRFRTTRAARTPILGSSTAEMLASVFAAAPRAALKPTWKGEGDKVHREQLSVEFAATLLLP